MVKFWVTNDGSAGLLTLALVDRTFHRILSLLSDGHT